MKKKEQKLVRFYSDNPEHRKAFDILQKINAEKHSSIQDFIISAINLLGDMELNEECPEEDRKDWEEPLIERIAGAVETIIDEKLIWYGNINFLGYTENEECCMRIVDNKIASEIESEILKF